jgi:hypothetical protein
MRIGSLRVWPRRGAWGIGSRRAKAGAAACSAALGLALAVPQDAVAYPCGEGPRSAAPTGELRGLSPGECGVPRSLHRREAGRPRKRGNLTGLTVFVLAVAGALLIPIGRSGTVHTGDPFGRARDGDAS